MCVCIQKEKGGIIKKRRKVFQADPELEMDFSRPIQVILLKKAYGPFEVNVFLIFNNKT